MDINNKQDFKQQIKQSTATEHEVLTSYQAYCTEHAPHWSGNCYSTRRESQNEANLHNNHFHNGHAGASVSEHAGNCVK